MTINLWLAAYLILTVVGWVMIFANKETDNDGKMVTFFANIIVLFILVMGGAFDTLIVYN